ncbi:hypothetical protein Tco_1200320 [Tanacetum coccineum]
MRLIIMNELHSSLVDAILSEGFLPSILLLVVIIVMVVIVVVILIVIVVAIVGVVIVVMIFRVVVVVDDLPPMFEASRQFHFFILIVATSKLSDSDLSNQRMRSTAHFRAIEVERLTANKLFIVSHFCYRSSNNVVEEEDGERIRFLGGNNSSGIKKYRGSNSSYGGNTRDGFKIAGEVIGSGGEIVKELLLNDAAKEIIDETEV